MNANEVIDLLAQHRVLIFVRGGKLEFLCPPGAYTLELRQLANSYRGELVTALCQPPRPARWPIDWREEHSLERRLLLARLAICTDGETKQRLVALARERPDSLDAVLLWGERLRDLEAELRAAGKLPGYPWESGPAVAA
jgi:hypothetical protein